MVSRSLILLCPAGSNACFFRMPLPLGRGPVPHSTPAMAHSSIYKISRTARLYLMGLHRLMGVRRLLSAAFVFFAMVLDNDRLSDEQRRQKGEYERLEEGDEDLQ